MGRPIARVVSLGPGIHVSASLLPWLARVVREGTRVVAGQDGGISDEAAHLVDDLNAQAVLVRNWFARQAALPSRTSDAGGGAGQVSEVAAESRREIATVELAAALGLGPRWASELARRERIRCRLVGRSTWWDAEDVEAWLARRRVRGRAHGVSARRRPA